MSQPIIELKIGATEAIERLKGQSSTVTNRIRAQIDAINGVPLVLNGEVGGLIEAGVQKTVPVQETSVKAFDNVEDEVGGAEASVGNLYDTDRSSARDLHL